MMPSWLKGSALLVVVLAAGLVIGFRLGRSEASTEGSHGMDPTRFIQNLTRDLGLDSTQRTSIARIMARRQATIDSAWRALRPGVRAAIDSTQMEIVNVLRPEQQAKFMKLLRTAHGTTGMTQSPGITGSGR